MTHSAVLTEHCLATDRQLASAYSMPCTICTAQLHLSQGKTGTIKNSCNSPVLPWRECTQSQLHVYPLEQITTAIPTSTCQVLPTVVYTMFPVTLAAHQCKGKCV